MVQRYYIGRRKEWQWRLRRQVNSGVTSGGGVTTRGWAAALHCDEGKQRRYIGKKERAMKAAASHWEEEKSGGHATNGVTFGRRLLLGDNPHLYYV